jgi:hypothetical protein
MGQERAADTYWRVLCALRELCLQSRRPVDKKELLERAARKLHGKLSLRTVQRACAWLAELGLVANEKGSTEYLPLARRAKTVASNVLSLPPARRFEPKSAPAPYIPAAPARRPVEPIDAAQLDAVDEELASTPQKSINPVIQLLEAPRRDPVSSAEIGTQMPSDRSAGPQKAERHLFLKVLESAAASGPEPERGDHLLVEVGSRQCFVDPRFLRAARVSTFQLALAAGELDIEGHKIDGDLARRVVAYAKQIRDQEQRDGIEPTHFRTDYSAARQLAPRYLAKNGLGRRRWRAEASQ